MTPSADACPPAIVLPSNQPGHERLPRTPHPWVRRSVAVLVLALVVEYAVLPQLVGARAALDLVAGVAPQTLLVALGLEVCSLLSYSALTRSLLPPAGRPPYSVLLRIDLAALGTSHVVPGGGATSAGVRYRLMTRARVDGRAAVATTAIQTVSAMSALVVIFTVGVALAFGHTGDHVLFETAGVVALVLVAVFGAVVGALLRAPESTRRRLTGWARRVPRVDSGWVDRLVVTFTGQLHAQVADRRLLLRTVTWSFANWLFDAAALWTCLRALGWTDHLGPLLAAYGLANLLAVLPVTPGGLGIIEGVLVPVLVSAGSPHAVALLGVLIWRLVEFWLPIPVSWLAYLSLRLGPFRERRKAQVPVTADR